MKHFGDITKINGHDVPVVDIVTGGSPCQDLSVAGKRAGLAGERSGLFMEQIRIIKEMRKKYVETNRLMGMVRVERSKIKPRYMVWENVPGAFSSNNGEDFRAVLEETARIAEEGVSIPRLAEGQKWSNAGAICGDGWSIAWRVHDAQFWGVPQRRKRISLLADFNGYSAADLLFECFRETSVDGVYEVVTNTGNEPGQEIQSFTESVPRNFESCGTKREAVAGDAKGSVRISGENRMSNIETAYVLDVYNQTTNVEVTHPIRSKSADSDHIPVMYGINGNISGTLDASYYKGCGERNGVEREVVVYNNNHVKTFSQQRCDEYKVSDEASTCSHRDYKSAKDLVVSFTTEMTPKIDDNGVAFSLRERDYKDAQSVAYGASSFGQYKDGFGTLKANGGDIGGGSETLIVERN